MLFACQGKPLHVEYDWLNLKIWNDNLAAYAGLIDIEQPTRLITYCAHGQIT
jgi:hypothetical protein